MPVTVEEKQIGRRSSTSSTQRAYVIRGAATEADALTGLLAGVPATIGSMTLASRDCDVDEVVVGDVWFGIAKWKMNDGESQPPDSFHISFDISGTQTHITQSIATVAMYNYSGTGGSYTGRDFQGTIGVNEDGSIEGCDVLVPTVTFQINYTFDEGDVDNAYINTLYSTVGKTNSDVFHNFPVRSCLFTKVSGSKRGDGNWDLSFSFSVTENKTGMTVGNITGVAKKGWEYLWVHNRSQTYEVSGVTYVTQRPSSVHIEQVYHDAAYSALGI